MWTIIGQSGVMSSVADFSAVFAPIVWGLVGTSVLSAAAIIEMALREYRAQRPTQPQESEVEELQTAA